MAQIQVSQVQTAINIIPTLENQLDELSAFLQGTQQIISNNFSVSVPGSTDQIILTAQQQTDMLTAYTALKAALQATFATLP